MKSGNIFIGFTLFFLYTAMSIYYQQIIEEQEARYKPRPIVFERPMGTVEGDLIIFTFSGSTYVGYEVSESTKPLTQVGWAEFK